MINFILGAAVGSIATAIVLIITSLVRTSFGTLVINKSDPDKDSYNIVINDLDKVEHKRRVDLKVSVINDSSQN